MTREIKLDPLAIGAIATRHETAASGIEDSAESMPVSVDGGLASAQLGAIIAGVAGTASKLADLNAGTGAVVRDTAGHFGDTEAEVATSLREMSDKLS